MVQVFSICRVCHAARAWTLPILYETIVLSSLSEIERFSKSQTETAESDVVMDRWQRPAFLVRKLWFGSTSSIENHVLDHLEPSQWPRSFMRQILTRCTSLCSLAAVNYCSWPLTGLTGAIPSSVSSLTLGPAHEPINFCSLPCARNLRTLNSINTYMDDSEIYAFVTGLSALRTVRRIFTYPPDSSAVVGFAFQQIGCFYPSSSAKRAFERLEIVCYGKTEDEAERDMENEARQWQCDPAQVTLVPRVWVTNNGQKDYFATLFEAWEREAYDASGIRISS